MSTLPAKDAAPSDKVLTEETLLSPSQKWKHEPVWYFAYGSNMKAATMTNRKITPLSTKVVQIPSHYLTFDIFGIPFSEPSYASIEAFPEGEEVDLFWRGKDLGKVPPVMGIAYLITPEDFHRLLSTEGGGVVYDCIECEGTIVNAEQEDEQDITVYTLKAKRPLQPNGCPSLRYMGLFRDGASVMNLPPSYQNYLESMPAYTKHEPFGSGIFTYLWRPFLKQVVRLTRWNVDADGNCPRWVAKLIVFLYEGMWVYHDVIHRNVFQGGDGGKLEFRVVREKAG